MANIFSKADAWEGSPTDIPRLDGLAPLYKRRIFHSHRKVDSHAQVTSELAEHDLCWMGDEVDTTLFKASLHHLQFFVLRYGAEVVVRPRLFDGFALVHMTLRGAAEIEADGCKVSLPQGAAALIAPQRKLRLWWQTGTEQLILKIPMSLFSAGADDHCPPTYLRPAALLPESILPYWNVLVQSLLKALTIPGHDVLQAPWIEHLERGAIQFLRAQCALGSCRTESVSVDTAIGQNCERSGGERLNDLERYIRKNLATPLGLPDLAKAAGVSLRSLNALCHEHRSAAPMRWLRNIRLDAVHERLKSQTDVCIGDIAFECGFVHMSRFAAYYRERFGELPNRTLSDTVSEF